MNLTLSHEAHEQQKPSHRQNVKTRTQLREGADAMLRDIAFVLKMTQKVRDEFPKSPGTAVPGLSLNS